MNEVDYSAFFYRRKDVSPDEKPQAVSEDLSKVGTETVTAQTNGEASERKWGRDETPRNKKRRAKKIGVALMTVAVVVLLFAITFFCVDFFTNGKILTKVFSAFRGSDYEYYFVVTDRDKRDYAYAQSLLVKQSGGAGYVIAGESFSVAYSVYYDRTEAEKVVEKNGNTYVKPMGFSTKNTEYCNEIDGYLRTLSALITSFEKGETSESEAYSSVNKVAERAKRYLSDREKTLSDGERNLLEYIASALGKKDFSVGVKAAFLSDLRYALCSIVYSFCRACA